MHTAWFRITNDKLKKISLNGLKKYVILVSNGLFYLKTKLNKQYQERAQTLSHTLLFELFNYSRIVSR